MATKLFHLKKKSVSFLKFYKIVWSPPLFIIWSNLQPNASIQGCSLTAAHQWPSRLIGTGSPNQHWYWWAYRMLSLNRSLQPAGPAVHSFKSPPFLVAQVKRQITIDSTWCYQLNTSSFIPSHKVSWQRLMAPDSNDKARQVPGESATFFCNFNSNQWNSFKVNDYFLRNSNWISTSITWRATAHVRDKLG